MEKNKTIKSLPEDMRPYEKCETKGEKSLTDAELLAVILRTGAAGKSSVELAFQILSLSKGYSGLSGMYHLSRQHLMEIRGVGKVKALQVKCLCELSRRIAEATAREKLAFHDPGSIADYYMERLRHEEQEVLICMMLDTKEHLLGEKVISRGTVNASLVSPRELFLAALSYHAVSILLVHNHPSGDPTPSREDKLVTKRIAAVGELLEIGLLDHIIIGDHRFCSFMQENLL